MSKSIEQLESFFPMTIGQVTFTKLEEPSLLSFTLEGDSKEQYIDWMDQDIEWSSFADGDSQEYDKVLELVNATILAANLKENILKPWYFATQGM